ncbi:MAG: hypothetical protein QW478_07750 [Candidatus Micrarchaeaceae archaeon]
MNYKEWYDSITADKVTEFNEQLQALKGNSRIETVDNLIVRRINKNYDAVVAYTGYEGTGKSTMSIEMGMDIGKKLGNKLDLEANVLYNPTYDSLIRKVQLVPFKSPVIVDEAIKTMYSRNWGQKDQRKLNTIFATIRERNLFVALNIPAFAELDSFFKNFRVLLWIHIFARGIAGLFVKDPNPFTTDPFNIRKSYKIIDEQIKKTNFNVQDIIELLRDNVPNFVTSIRFNPLPPKIEARYKELKRKYSFEAPQLEKTAKEQYDALIRDTIVELFESSDKWTVDALAKRFNLTVPKVRKIIAEARAKNATAEAPVEQGDSNEQV